MKQSKIKRLAPKKRVQQCAGQDAGALEAMLRREGADTIAKMHAKGYELVSCLETGEGVFVRDEAVVGLHIQLPRELYDRLDAACRRQETTKRSVVVEALEKHLPPDNG